ncbi:uncharacterized protein LOC130755979 [Actinidia eriantha]|uniref:uncharacterized protein LOC130755979 n=1 Tax=Actinidia eriantha TaxID=165200 RepID=UPI00258B833E|nr:uncharacterized protein LOC130755979 [Actinidia eriantha]
MSCHLHMATQLSRYIYTSLSLPHMRMRDSACTHTNIVIQIWIEKTIRDFNIRQGCVELSFQAYEAKRRVTKILHTAAANVAAQAAVGGMAGRQNEILCPRKH